MYQIRGKRYRSDYYISIACSKNADTSGLIHLDKNLYAKRVKGWIYVIENIETGYIFKVGVQSDKPDHITDLKTGMLLFAPDYDVLSVKRERHSIKRTIEMFLDSAYPNAYECNMKKGTFDKQINGFKGINNAV